MALTGMVMSLQSQEAETAQEDMTDCFVEEFALLGKSAEEILTLFKDPGYRFTHELYQTRGEATIRGVIQRVLNGKDLETADNNKENGNG